MKITGNRSLKILSRIFIWLFEEKTLLKMQGENVTGIANLLG
jgi:hypothetical protein